MRHLTTQFDASTIDGHLKIPPLGAFDAPTPEHSKNIRLRGSAQAIVFRLACIEASERLPIAVRAAAEAVKANPEKSDRAIAADIGVSKDTVREVRDELATTSQLEDGPRVGLDGKTRRLPVREVARRPTESLAQEGPNRPTNGGRVSPASGRCVIVDPCFRAAARMGLQGAAP
jgi:hypothetical protein